MLDGVFDGAMEIVGGVDGALVGARDAVGDWDGAVEGTVDTVGKPDGALLGAKVVFVAWVSVGTTLGLAESDGGSVIAPKSSTKTSANNVRTPSSCSPNSSSRSSS